MTTLSNGKAALDALFWRAEILQALFWMRGEGIADDVDPRRLAEFLDIDVAVIDGQMHALVTDGFLAKVSAARYTLTDLGRAEGARGFQDEFAALTHAAHYECAPGCWCHDPDHVGEPCPSTPTPRPAEPEPDPAEPDADPKPRHAP